MPSVKYKYDAVLKKDNKKFHYVCLGEEKRRHMTVDDAADEDFGTENCACSPHPAVTFGRITVTFSVYPSMVTVIMSL